MLTTQSAGKDAEQRKLSNVAGGMQVEQPLWKKCGHTVLNFHPQVFTLEK
jgi:hypothetical protein